MKTRTIISKQKRNLINELSFYLLTNIQTENVITQEATPIETVEETQEAKAIIFSSKHYTNKQIKILIHDLKYQLPF